MEGSLLRSMEWLHSSFLPSNSLRPPAHPSSMAMARGMGSSPAQPRRQQRASHNYSRWETARSAPGRRLSQRPERQRLPTFIAFSLGLMGWFGSISLSLFYVTQVLHMDGYFPSIE
ncbi:hypothetical protein VPH35_075949 [Triticum aestivum]